MSSNKQAIYFPKKQETSLPWKLKQLKQLNKAMQITQHFRKTQLKRKNLQLPSSENKKLNRRNVITGSGYEIRKTQLTES